MMEWECPQAVSLYCLMMEWECPQAVSLFVLLDDGVRMSPGSLSLCTAWWWSENVPRQSLCTAWWWSENVPRQSLCTAWWWSENVPRQSLSLYCLMLEWECPQAVSLYCLMMEWECPQAVSLYCLMMEWECPQAVSLFVLLDDGVRMSPGRSLCAAWWWSENVHRQSLCTAWWWSENVPRQSLCTAWWWSENVPRQISLYCLMMEWECPQADLFVLLDVGVRMSPGSLFVLLDDGVRMSPGRINKKGVNLSSKDVAQTQHKLRNILCWSLCPLCLLACQMRVTCHTNTTQAPQHPQVEFMYIAFTCMPGESYCRRLRSLFLCLCDVFWVLINSLACWLCTGALGFVLFQIVFWGKLSRQQTVYASEVFKQMQYKQS